MSIINELIGMFVILLLFCAGVIAFGLVALHDIPIAEDIYEDARINYVNRLSYNMSGIEQIEIAREVCTDEYLKTADSDMILKTTLFKIDIDKCITNLVTGD